MEIDVKEASRRLGVNDSRVRQLLRAGDLRGRHLGNSWLILAEDVARLQRNGRRPGRPLAPKRAWAALDLLDGGGAAWLSDSARSQVRRYLADLVDPGPDDWRAVLRGRSRVLDVVAHPAAIERLRRRRRRPPRRAERSGRPRVRPRRTRGVCSRSSTSPRNCSRIVPLPGAQRGGGDCDLQGPCSERGLAVRRRGPLGTWLGWRRRAGSGPP